MLSSYAVIPWSKVFIYYKLDADFAHQKQELDTFISALFPDNLVLRNFRIDSYSEWMDALLELDNESDQWIWFSCNDDHIFIDSDLSHLNQLLQFADKKAEDHKFVAIEISHWQEALAEKEKYRILETIKSPLAHSPLYEARVLEETEFCSVTNHRMTTSIQIINKNIFKYWFSERNLLPLDLRRTDEITVMPRNQVSIIPRKELVRHFDGYTHSGISLEVVPVMMIPNGFFEGKLKIQYGFEHRKAGFVWIHPIKEMIAKELPHGERDTLSNQCDMNILLEELPLFWKERIDETQIAHIDEKKLRRAYLRQKLKEICADPRLGYTPRSGYLQYRNQIFKAKYPDVTEGELREVASRIWGVSERVTRTSILMTYLRTSRVTAYKIPWLFFYVWQTIKNPTLLANRSRRLISRMNKTL
jgi:hypothetical protein